MHTARPSSMSQAAARGGAGPGGSLSGHTCQGGRDSPAGFMAESETNACCSCLGKMRWPPGLSLAVIGNLEVESSLPPIKHLAPTGLMLCIESLAFLNTETLCSSPFKLPTLLNEV